MKRKRRVFEIRWAHATERERFKVWCMFERGAKTPVLDGTKSKRLFVKLCAGYLKSLWIRGGVLSELVIKNRDGRIGKGSSGRRSFGRDPRRSPG